jgi:hypothetical protein
LAGAFGSARSSGRAIGLILDGAYFVFVLITISLMLVVCTMLAVLDHFLSPILTFTHK